MNPRSPIALLVSCFLIPAALTGCDRNAPPPPAENPAAPQAAGPAAPQEDALSTTMPPEEVFQRALWRRPAADDKILHAERREWTNDGARGVERWQWFLAVDPGVALKKWLREQNPFSVRPVGNADAPEIKDAPAWFPADNSGYIVHTGGTTGSLTFLWSRQGQTLYATGSGSGFQPGVAGPATPPPAPEPQDMTQGRLPQTPPPTAPQR